MPTHPTPPPGYRGHWRPDRSQPAEHTATLLIDPSWTYCGGCERMADPHQGRHTTVPPGMSSHPPQAGCGAVFTALSSHYGGERIATAARALRPDLPWQPPGPNAAPWPAGPNPNTYRVQVTLQVTAYSPDEASDHAQEAIAGASDRNPNVTAATVHYPPQLAR